MAGKPAEPFPAITATPLLLRGEADPAFVAVQVYLRRFGYLGEGTFDAGTLDDETAEALALYQRRNGLVVTATFDDQTRRRMVAHRCGMPDLVNRVAFVVRCSWTHPCLTFAFDFGTNDVAGNDEFEAVRAAVATWAAVTPLTFTEVGVSYHPDIVIGWRPADGRGLRSVGDDRPRRLPARLRCGQRRPAQAGALQRLRDQLGDRQGLLGLRRRVGRPPRRSVTSSDSSTPASQTR